MAIAKLVGSVFDLSALDGITIADDYNEALKGIERGYPGMNAPTPTRDEFGTGQAMAIPVLRDGKHKSHIVVNSLLVRPLVDPGGAYYQFAAKQFARAPATPRRVTGAALIMNAS